jgi:hypothetical protein
MLLHYDAAWPTTPNTTPNLRGSTRKAKSSSKAARGVAQAKVRAADILDMLAAGNEWMSIDELFKKPQFSTVHGDELTQVIIASSAAGGLLEIEDRTSNAYKLRLALGKEIDKHKGKSGWANAKDINMTETTIRRTAGENPLLFEWDMKQLARSVKVVDHAQAADLLNYADFRCPLSDGTSKAACKIKCEDNEGWCRNALRICRKHEFCIAVILSSDKSWGTLKRERGR